MNERKEVLIREARKSDLDALVSLRVALQRHVEQANPHLWQLTDEGETIMKKEVKTMLEEEGKSTIVAQTNEKLKDLLVGIFKNMSVILPGGPAKSRRFL